MNTFKILSFLLLTLYLNASAQIKPLKVGDRVPDIVFTQMLNHTASNAKLSDFKGKAVILDFWFRECGSCIELFPELNRIQNKYKNDLKIILVTWQSRKKIEEFWREHKEVGNLIFTQAVEDSTARQYFPATAFPHQIWIDKNGIIKSINDGMQLTAENLEKLIQANDLKLKVKEDEINGAIRNAVEPMAGIKFEQNKDKIIHYSYLSKPRPEFAGMRQVGKDGEGTVRVKFMNVDYISMYHYAYAGKTGVPLDPKSRVLRKDHNPLPKEPDYKDFTNVFCYDLIYPDTTVSGFGYRMIRDLDHYLGFKSREVTKKILSYVIEPDGRGLQYFEPLEADKRPYMTNQHLEKLTNVEINKIPAMSMATQYISRSDIPVVFNWPLDHRRVSFKVIWDPEHLDLMNEQLKAYNLKISLKKWKTKVIELTDPK
ncbi:redoxin family protein [Chryseobacterium sp. MHB01]|uniref:TlpA family protein disulfide reductase n=1 Tax=Chryseobacterium sp. MHB01 TaxID=3109433 RepID=UPI002AFEF7A9|nr:redoxin family protein [Chryseobacterium sp. MHB01]MEA1849892.1 redoxin family protein [Chryseobacterium sp. MHB01]